MGNNKNPPITNKIWSLDSHHCGVSLNHDTDILNVSNILARSYVHVRQFKTNSQLLVTPQPFTCASFSSFLFLGESALNAKLDPAARPRLVASVPDLDEESEDLKKSADGLEDMIEPNPYFERNMS